MRTLISSAIIFWSLHYSKALIVPSNRQSAFVPSTSTGVSGSIARYTFCASDASSVLVRARHHSQDDLDNLKPCAEDEQKKSRRVQLRKRLLSKIKFSLALLSPVAMASSTIPLVASPQKANAGAPVMAMPKMKTQDPSQAAFDLHEKKLMAEAQKELSDFQSKAREIEKQQGSAARERFESDYKESQKTKAVAFKEGLLELKRNLLDQGIVPLQDIEGKRQVILYEKGVDLGEVDGTKFNLEKRYEAQGSDKSFAFRKKSNREVIKAMVQDLKNRGIDPLDYFERNKPKIDMILNLPADRAAMLATKYDENLELYGQITPPNDGEKSVKELMSERVQNDKSKDNGRNERKRMKVEAKAKAAAEKVKAKEKAKAEKERLKKEKQDLKKSKHKETEVSEGSVNVVSAGTGVVATTPKDTAGSIVSVPVPEDDSDFRTGSSDGLIANDHAVVVTDGDSPVLEAKKSSRMKIITPAAVVVSVGGGAYALKMVRDRSAAEEAERRRQFKLLMGEIEGETSDSTVDNSEPDDSTISDLMYEYENLTEEDDDKDKDKDEVDENPPNEIESSRSKPIKRRRGLKSVFKKKKNDRDVDIAVLVAPTAKASEFSKTLAKILTFGAPGRFPEVMKLPGEMPMESFDIEKATAILMEARDSAGITKDESAEIFANMVNCMLIDIVDLASTSLKEKDQKVTTDALGIVIKFMDLAAQLYTSIAEGIDIVPVTYGGDISKKKLEQMYSTYAISGMMDMSNIDEKFDDRVNLLQDVFQISPKRAEGLMMKAMQKNMMEMMKSGKMPDGMEDMMKEMEGVGLPGLGGDEEPDPEQLKEMLRVLKDLKDSGSLPENELNEVKKQFKDAFGDSIDEVMKNASNNQDELGEADQELLDLMKSILE